MRLFLVNWVECSFRSFLHTIPFLLHSSVMASLLERAIRFTLFQHLLAIGIKSIIDDPLGSILFMIIFIAQVTEALSNGVESCRLWLLPQRVVGISPIDNLAKQYQRWISGQAIFLENGFKGTLLAVVAQFHIFHIIGDGPFALGDLHHLIGGHKEELGFLVYEFFNQPGASYTVYFHSFACNPFHVGFSPPSFFPSR